MGDDETGQPDSLGQIAQKRKTAVPETEFVKTQRERPLQINAIKNRSRGRTAVSVAKCLTTTQPAFDKPLHFR